jgi:hypothetical protein
MVSVLALFRAITLVALGGLVALTIHMRYPWVITDPKPWVLALTVGLIGWSWGAIFAFAANFHTRLLAALGVKAPRRDDAAALADELRALRVQVTEMRETASAFDLSFDAALERLDRRVERVEQKSEYVQIGRS